MLVYSDDRVPFTGKPTPYLEQRANDHFLKHYANGLYLDFIAKESRDNSERAQARKELMIAETKMTHWKRHPNFEVAVVTRETEKLKAQWQQQGTKAT